MNVSIFRPRPLSSSVFLAAAIAFGAAFPALADNSVTQTLSPGILTASVTDGTMSAITVSHVDQTSTGTLVLNANDSTGSGAGWNVTLLASPFSYTGSYTQASIAAANFGVASAAQPNLVAGQAVSLTAANGPEVPPISPVGSLGSARKVLMATAAYGSGSYTQDVGVSLLIPADSRPGTYSGTLTTTIISGSV